MKVGIIRCMQTEDYCPGTTDFYAVKKKVGAFADLEGDLKIVQKLILCILLMTY